MNKDQSRWDWLVAAALALVLALAACAPVPTRTSMAPAPTLTQAQVVLVATQTPTEAPPTPTATQTLSPTSTPALSTPTSTATASAVPPTATATATATRTAAPPIVAPLSGMVHVPAGEFVMGGDEGGSDERPVHAVYLDDFYVDKTEVTNAQFAGFLNERGNQEEGGATWLHVEDEACLIAEIDGQYRPKNGYESHPVVEVTWHGAVAYCEWAGRRLPTEAEWEKAARGTDGRTYPWGEGIDCDRANYGGCAGQAIEVGSLPSGASPYGALDMAGNVYEWVLDWYDGVYYAASPSSNPQGPVSGSCRSVRGGSWVNGEKRVGVTARFSNAPDNAINNVGFRCARSGSEP
jgi:formylglycine-generating enzyme required for sulfatase activity